MKRMVVVLGVAALMAALIAGPVAAQAQSEMINERIHFTSITFNPCTGDEAIVIKGTLHIVTHFTLDAAGGVHFKGYTGGQSRGVSTSGAKYVIVSATDGHQFISDSADNFTFNERVNFIRQGSATPEDDFQGHILIHFTRNANGEITAEFANFEFECR
jgi:hypothetical protein